MNDRRISGVPAVLGSCAPGGDHTRTRDVLRCGTNVYRWPRAWSGIELWYRCWSFVHIIVGAIGISSLVMASAEAFTLLKLGRSCLSDLAWLQDMERSRDRRPYRSGDSRCRRVFRQDIIVEALNPKSAAFFLAFTPQFIEQPPMSPGSLSSLGSFQLRSILLPMWS